MKSSRRPAALALAVALGAASALVAASPASAAPVSPAAQVAQVSTVQVSAVAVPAASSGQLSAKAPFAGLTPKKIKNKSVAAMKTAKTFRVSGTQKVAKATMTINLCISGPKAYGDITVGKSTMHVRRIGTDVYLLPEGSSYFVKITKADAQYKDIVKLLTPSQYAAWLATANVSYRAAGVKVTGTPTVRLWQPGKKGGSFYVASTGPAYPRWVYRDDKTMNFVFSDYNAAVDVPEPDPSTVVTR